MTSLPPPPAFGEADPAAFDPAVIGVTVYSAGTPFDPAAGESAAEPGVAVLRSGQLTSAWRITFVVGWVAVILGLAAVVKTSRTMGLSTWWLGASGDPRVVFVQALPFIPSVLVIIAASRNSRFVPVFGVITSALVALIATGDIGRFDRLAIVQFVVAGGGLLVSVAACAGMVRNDGRVRSVPMN